MASLRSDLSTKRIVVLTSNRSISFPAASCPSFFKMKVTTSAKDHVGNHGYGSSSKHLRAQRLGSFMLCVALTSSRDPEVRVDEDLTPHHRSPRRGPGPRRSVDLPSPNR